MSRFGLNRNERMAIEVLVSHSPIGSIVRRGLALLRIDEGQSLASVASSFRVSRQTIYNWISGFCERQDLNLVSRLSENPHPGRPRHLHGRIEPLLEDVLDSNPMDLGYPSTVWTADLLTQYLEEKHGVMASNRSVRYALKRLDYSWKRPRHSLSRRSPAWQQQKGGSNTDSESVCERSF